MNNFEKQLFKDCIHNRHRVSALRFRYTIRQWPDYTYSKEIVKLMVRHWGIMYVFELLNKFCCNFKKLVWFLLKHESGWLILNIWHFVKICKPSEKVLSKIIKTYEHKEEQGLMNEIPFLIRFFKVKHFDRYARKFIILWYTESLAWALPDYRYLSFQTAKWLIKFGYSDDVLKNLPSFSKKVRKTIKNYIKIE
jgi:hypothetical protein